jgi:hypothetical protein
MPRRTIRADEILTDIMSGMGDTSLMEKYDLSARALLKVMTKLFWKGRLSPVVFSKRKSLINSVLTAKHRRIVSGQVLQDIRSGMGDAELQEKYKLSSKGLVRLLERLVDSKLISQAELSEMSGAYRNKVGRIYGRSHVRAHITVPIPVYDIGAIGSSAIGLLRDISLEGFRIAGIESNVGDVKTFQLPLDMFMKAHPLILVGECFWVAPRVGNQSYWVTGYRMETVTETDADAITKFINFLLFTDSGQWKTVP